MLKACRAFLWSMVGDPFNRDGRLSKNPKRILLFGLLLADKPMNCTLTARTQRVSSLGFLTVTREC